MGLYGFADARDLMAWQIVHDDDVIWLENRSQELFGPSSEVFAIHRPIKRHRCVEAITAQGGDESRGTPMTMWCFGQKPLAYG